MFSFKVFGKKEKKTVIAALDVANPNNPDPVELLASNADNGMNEELLGEAIEVIKALKPDSLPKELARCHMVIVAAKKVISYHESCIKEMIETHKRITTEKDKQIEMLAKHGDSDSPTAITVKEDSDLLQGKINEFKGDTDNLRKYTNKAASTEMIDKSIQTSEVYPNTVINQEVSLSSTSPVKAFISSKSHQINKECYENSAAFVQSSVNHEKADSSFISSHIPDLSSESPIKCHQNSERDVKSPMVRRWHSLNRAVEPIRKKKQKLFARLTSRFEERGTSSAWVATSSRGNTDVTMNKRVLQAEEAFWKVQGELEALRKKMNESERWEEQVHAQVATIADQRTKIDALRAKLQGFKLVSPQKKDDMELVMVEESVMVEQKIDNLVEIGEVAKIDQSVTIEKPANTDEISKIKQPVEEVGEPAVIECKAGASQPVETKLPVEIIESAQAEHSPVISQSVKAEPSDEIELNVGTSQLVEAEQFVKTELPIEIKESAQAKHSPGISQHVEVEPSDEIECNAGTSQPVEVEQFVKTELPVEIEELSQDEHTPGTSRPVEPSNETELLEEVSKTPSNQMLGAGENVPVTTKSIDEACVDHVEVIELEEN